MMIGIESRTIFIERRVNDTMKRRLVYPDVLRAAACVATVLFSTCIAAGYTPAIGLLTWVCPMFLMLSGMFVWLSLIWYGECLRCWSMR